MAKLPRWLFVVLLLVACLMVAGASNHVAATVQLGQSPGVAIRVPMEDRFTPYAVTVKVGTPVRWINNDEDDHTLVSDDAFNTAGNRGVDVVLPANGGSYTLTFDHAGTFPFYCRLHAMLDSHNQPKAPGPEGGIQDSDGNYGTPMAGVVTVTEN